MTPGDEGQGESVGSRSAARDELFELLRRDHAEILELFLGIERCGQGERDALLKLLNRLQEDLQRHLEGEERFFFSALEPYDEARELVLEYYELHHLARIAIGACNTLALDDERWLPKVRVLRRLAQHHIRSVEEDLFPVAARVLGTEQLRGIAAQMVGLKREAVPRRAGVDAPR